MEIKSQHDAIAQLQKLSSYDRHSILIEGPKGCGKSYLANQFANFASIEDIAFIPPKVSDLRDAIDSSLLLSNNIELVVENLDLGVAGASYTLLKSLEEPADNLYMIITCRNIDYIPDTIVSRSAVVSVNVPTQADLCEYAQAKDSFKFSTIKDSLVWQCARSFHDVDAILSMKPSQIEFYANLDKVAKFKDSVSNISWQIGHYEDGSECDIELAIRCIMRLCGTKEITSYGISCLRDLDSGRIAKHAALSKFIFLSKYWI